jgi:TatD DNase family protein
MNFQKLLEQNDLFDSHCHFNSAVYNIDRKDLVNRAIQNNVEIVIDIGIDEDSSRKAVAIAKQFSGNVYAAVGVDPQLCIPGDEMYVDDMSKLFSQFGQISKLAYDNRDKVIMVGETGLDLYWMKVKKLDEHSVQQSYKNQKMLFEKHIELASELDLPLSIHSRESIDECIEILSKYNVGGVFHSLTPEVDDNEESFEKKVRTILEMGFYISLNGIITYKSANLLRNTIFKILRSKNDDIQDPIDFYEAGFIFETDGPYLSPEGKRGERNVPENIKGIYQFLVSLFN